MNEHDRSNLNFLLNASAETLKDWYEKMDEDDHLYAQELLAMAALELKEQALELRVEAELALDPKFTLANQLITSVKQKLDI